MKSRSFSSILCMLFISSMASAWTTVKANMKGWDTKVLHVAVNTSNCSLPSSTVIDAIDRSFDLWNQIPTAGLKLERKASTTSVASLLAGTATDPPAILCDSSFSSNLGVDGNVIPGLALSPTLGSQTQITYTGMVLNSESAKAAHIGNISNDELVIVISHELGHILGLGHSQAREALMYYSISNKIKAVVTSDDADGLTYLYPRNEFSSQPFGCAAVHQKKTFPNVSWLLIGGIFFLAFCVGRVVVKPERLL